MKFRAVGLILLVFLASSLLSAESVTVVNRTGDVLDLIQAAPRGVDQWGRDLIPDRVLADGESVVLNLVGQAPWSFRFMDSSGEVYVLYDVRPSTTGKISVGPEHLARISRIAGAHRTITLVNRSEAVLTELRISAVTDGRWGSDLLQGRYIRSGERVEVELTVIPGTLSFDIRFTLLSNGREITYDKGSVILTDGAALVLSLAAE